MIIINIIAYFAVVLAMCFYETFVGFAPRAYENYYDTGLDPPLLVAFLVWPIFLPILLIMSLLYHLNRLRDKRINNAKQK